MGSVTKIGQEKAGTGLVGKALEGFRLAILSVIACLSRISHRPARYVPLRLCASAYKHDSGCAYIGPRPSKKSVKRMMDSLTEETDSRRTLLDADWIVGRPNRKLRGWANYFCLGPVSPAYRAINTHTTQRLRRWLCKKHKVQGAGWSRYPDQYLHEPLGLVHLPTRTRSFPWANV